MPSILTYAVVSQGVGKRDYSLTVEKSTEPVISHRHRRASYSGTWAGIPTNVYPGWYLNWPMQWINEYGIGVDVAPRLPYHIYEIEVATPLSCLVYLSFWRFDSLADWDIFNPDAWYGDIYGYRKARFLWSRGLTIIEGKVYAIGFGVYSELPLFDLTVDAHSLIEDPNEYLG